jgi:uncharacterized protein DUF1439
MSKRQLAWIAVAVVGVLSIVGLLWSVFGTSKLVFTEADLQARLNQQLPRTVREVTIERVAVQLAESRMALRIEVRATAMRQPVSATVSARGMPRYEAQKGEMYFDADDVKIDQLTVAGRSVAGDEDAATRRRLTELAGAGVQRLAETAIKAYLATRPVYRFKDDFKGIVLKAALVDLTIEQSTMVVTFSVWNLTLTVAIYALVLIVLLLVIYWLIRHPLWGLRTIADLADTG